MTTSETNNAPQSLQSFWRRLRHTPVRDLLWHWRLTGRMDVEAILTSFALPASCADVVRRVVKKSRLWRLERAELTSELAAHFRDGLQEGLNETDLIRDFGDPAKAAKLIRRAKVRCRPMLWHVARGVFRAVVVFVLLYFVLVGYYALGKPEIKVNYLRQLNAAAEKVAPEDRAWPLYREAALQLGFSNKTKLGSPAQQIALAIRDDKPLTPELQHWLKEQSSALDLVRQGASKTGMGYVLCPGESSDDIPNNVFHPSSSDNPADSTTNANETPILIMVSARYLFTVRALARILDAETRIAWQEKDRERVIANLRTMEGLANQCYEIADIGPVFTGNVLHQERLRLISQILAETPEVFSDQNLQQLAHRLSRYDFRAQNVRMMAGRRATFADIVQRIYTDDGQGNGRVIKSAAEGLLEEGWMPFFEMPDFKSMRDPFSKILRLKSEDRNASSTQFKSVARSITLPILVYSMADRRNMMAKFDEIMKSYEAEMAVPRRLVTICTDDKVSEIQVSWGDRSRYYLLPAIMTLLSNFHDRTEVTEVTRDGVLLGVALTLFQRHQGHYPAALDELVPKYMPALPVDPMTGEPIHYRVTENGPLVYGVGGNRKDDGGFAPESPFQAREWRQPNMAEPPLEGDWVIWPMPKGWY